MFDENKEKQFILQLFNLECSDVQDVSCIRAGNTVIIDITLASDPVPCPVCGCDQPHIKNYVTKNITHSVLSDRRCTLRYHARRYVCPVCGNIMPRDKNAAINVLEEGLRILKENIFRPSVEGYSKPALITMIPRA